jgi:hypothetical protein
MHGTATVASSDAPSSSSSSSSSLSLLGVEGGEPSSGQQQQRVIILGGGIAGLSTARYLLHHHARMRNEGGGASGIMSITLIDRNVDATAPTNDEERIGRHRRPHRNIPSRRNGNYLCPSLTVPWTARPLWGEALMPGLRYAFAGGPRPPISFDWPSLIADRNMVRFLSSQDRPVVFVRTSLVGRRVERRLTISPLPRFFSATTLR